MSQGGESEKWKVKCKRKKKRMMRKRRKGEGKKRNGGTIRRAMREHAAPVHITIGAIANPIGSESDRL